MNTRIWSTEEKATLADLLGKVRAGLLPHFTRDTDINVSSGYETSDLPRLITRLAKYAPRSNRARPA